MALASAAQGVRARLAQTYKDYRQTGSGAADVAGEAGVELDYVATAADGQLLAVSQILAARDGTLYLLSRTARPQDIGAVRRAAAPILASWEWLT